MLLHPSLQIGATQAPKIKDRIAISKERSNMAKRKSSLMLCCLALLLALYNEVQAQFLPFSFGDSDNDCYVQCPTECPNLNLDMVDCVVYCKMKCACPADDAECATSKAYLPLSGCVHQDSTEDEAAAESPSASGPDEESTDGDLSFATEDGETSLAPEALEPEIDTTSYVIEMDLSPTSSAGPPTLQDAEAPESTEAAVATPQSASAATPQSAPAPTPRGATAPTSQGAVSPALQTAASPAPQKAAFAPNAPAPA